MRAVGSQPIDQLKRNVVTLAKAAKIMKLPVLFLAAPLPGDGAIYFPELLGVFPEPEMIQHKTNNSWLDSHAREKIKGLGKKNLVFAGIATDVGAGLAAMSAKAEGYNSFLLGDCSGTLNPSLEQMAFLRLSSAGVQLLGWTGFIGEVQEDYHAEDGRELLKLIGETLAQKSGPFAEHQ